jgi:hypothetical protein
MHPQQPPGYPPLPQQLPSKRRQAHRERWVIPVLAGAGGIILGAIIGVAAGRASPPPGRTVTQYGGLVS